MAELNVGAADHADGLDDGVGGPLQPLLQFLGHGEHGRGAERVAGVHAHGVHVLDEADGDQLVVRVAHHLEFQLLPADDALLDEDLADAAGGDAAGGDDAQLLQVVDHAAAGAAHGVGRADDHRIAEFGGDALGVLHRVHGGAARHLDAEPVHLLLELDPVFAALDGVQVDADHLHPVLLEDALPGQVGAEVEGRLAAQVGQQGVGPLAGDDLLQRVHVERLDVGDVGHLRVGHDRGRIGVDEHDAVTEFAQGLAGLGAGVVEFAGLTDDDRTGADDQDRADVVAFGHGCSPLCGAIGRTAPGDGAGAGNGSWDRGRGSARPAAGRRLGRAVRGSLARTTGGRAVVCAAGRAGVHGRLSSRSAARAAPTVTPARLWPGKLWSPTRVQLPRPKRCCRGGSQPVWA